MHSKENIFMGIDLGSVSLNVVIIDSDAMIRKGIYSRTSGRPLSTLQKILNDIEKDFHSVSGIVVSGSGRKLLGRIFDVPDVNEIVTQAKASSFLHPDTRTVIEIGGQDSKLIYMDRDQSSGETVITDHVLNEVCAAGTGSFLDLQAQRLGIPIEDFGSLAGRSKRPAKISGRCSVFAKSDMVHLVQEGTPKEDIIAGLCYALARNFITNLAKGRAFNKPILFQGGVAANSGVVKAFEDLLALGHGEIIIPEHYLVMGALGSALIARERGPGKPIEIEHVTRRLYTAMDQDKNQKQHNHLRPLKRPEDQSAFSDQYYGIGSDGDIELFLGVDVGSVSTNIVLLDQNGNLKAKQYWLTKGDPVDTLKMGFAELGRRVGEGIKIAGVGITGSGRYLMGDFIGADEIINEISAQSRAAIQYYPEVDSIIEIGGQDSKFIRCENGRVVDFDMNKVCAAGTGSFLEEQAARLLIKLEGDFSELAFSSIAPVNLGARCTVFMESDLIHHQQSGKRLEDLVSGLAYAIVYNYLEKVVGTRQIGDHILFQGGVAANGSVKAAFENVLGKRLITPEHYNVTGAIGAALTAIDRRPEKSSFTGFNIKERSYTVRSFECKKCSNLCTIRMVCIENKPNSYYGSLCGRYEKRGHEGKEGGSPDLFSERITELTKNYRDEGENNKDKRNLIGIPRVISFFDYFPFWAAFFNTLNHPFVVSEKSSRGLSALGTRYVPSETCLPIKMVYGHVCNLIEKGAEKLLIPSEIDCPHGPDRDRRDYNCSYIQSVPYMVRSSFGSRIELLIPVMRRGMSRKWVEKELLIIGKSLGYDPAKIRAAAEAAYSSQDAFDIWRVGRGKEIYHSLGNNEKAIILLGKTHNLYDPGLNLHVERKLDRLGMKIIPYDMLPLDEITLQDHYDNVVWKNTRDLLKAVMIICSDIRLFPVLLTNFGCGPDSFFIKYMNSEIIDRPILILEVDDHSSDVGMITRIEAFGETLKNIEVKKRQKPQKLNLIFKGKQKMADPWNADPDLIRLLENRTLYFPYVSSSFSYIVEAALKAIGFNAMALPRPDDETEYLGRQVTSGRECHPFIVTCGEFVKMTRLPGFDPERSAVMMLNYDGVCRFSQYGIGHADLFRRMGLSGIPVIAPLTSSRFDEFSKLFGLGYTKLLMEGWLSIEVLERMRMHIRPYEKKAGETDAVFKSCRKEMTKAVSGQGKHFRIWNEELFSVFKKCIRAMGEIPVDRSANRPVVGILGEFYSVLNRWVNRDLVRTFEGLGAEIRFHGLTVTNCFVLFSESYPRERLGEKRYGSSIYYYLRDLWLKRWITRIEKLMPEDLNSFGTINAVNIRDISNTYIYHDIDPVLSSFAARVRTYAESGVNGICNLFVLNCMLGNISVPILKSVLKDFGGVPLLHLIYDCQEQTNMITRIEAFMHQARLHHERENNMRKKIQKTLP